MLDKSILLSLEEIAGKGSLDIISERVCVFPSDKDKIKDIIKFAASKALKVLPIGKETKVVYDGLLKGDEIILRMDNFNSIKQVVPEDLYVIMGAGYDLSQINEKILSYNLFFPFGLDGIRGSLAGAVASGLVAGNGDQKIYIKDYVLSLEIMDGDGEVLNIGANVFKSVAGYDTTRLFVGSWGRLGVITEVGLRLVPLNRKKEFENMKFLSPRRIGLKKDSKDYNTVLSLRLKEALDPKSVFLSL
ncbi:MAG: FAD-binding oxidoreductase [candidate division Zixibacteria bacterium]|nr:FAD-binding oxidoreductase [candidate division Zixibacteria bacterium]